jgi:hypothetical protein
VQIQEWVERTRLVACYRSQLAMGTGEEYGMERERRRGGGCVFFTRRVSFLLLSVYFPFTYSRRFVSLQSFTVVPVLGRYLYRLDFFAQQGV